MTAYYNENDPYAAQWLRNLIAEGLIAPGDVDDRSIKDVRPDDLAGYTQCHFFAGIGGWSLALRFAGWPDDRPVWTGSCPCQPFSAAGKRKGFDDERHLWPVFLALIKERRPAKLYGEQVAAASEWLSLVRSDLEDLDYAVGTIPIEAASAGADHLRDRYWFVGDHQGDGWGEGRTEHEVRSWRDAVTGDGCAVDVAHTDRSGADTGRRDFGEVLGGSQEARQSEHGAALSSRDGHQGVALGDAYEPGSQGRQLYAECADQRSAWSAGVADADIACEGEGRKQRGGQFGRSGGDPETCALGDGPRLAQRESHDQGDALADGGQARSIFSGAGDHLEWVIGADGKQRRVKSGICLLAHGVPARVGKLRAFGNAIDPRPAAAFIRAAA